MRNNRKNLTCCLFKMFIFVITVYLFFPLIKTSEAKNILKKDINGYIEQLMTSKYVDRELILKFKDDVSNDEVAMVKASAIAHSQTGAIVKRKFKRLKGLQLVRLPKFKTVHQVLKSYLENPDIEYAEPNYIVRINTTSDDPDFNDLWGLHNIGQTGGTVDADIDAPEAWNINTGSSNVVVAVIDSGVDYAHEDLAPNIWANTGETPDNGMDDDDNGYIDDDIGWDFSRCEQFNSDNSCNVPKSEDNDPYDDYWHGTHCSGIIGAVGDNGIGVVGVNWGIQIMPLKFINSDGEGTTADAINAILYAVDNGANILSNSWGGNMYSSALEDAIIYANNNDVLVVASAGNNGTNNDITPFYPASYDVPNVIAVAATNHNDNMPSWSNYGASSVDIGAPGVGILSTRLGDGYFSKNGTSMAAPYVSGVAGLIKASNPSLTNLEVKNAILNNVDVKSSLTGKVQTGGRLNAYNALSYIANNNRPSIPNLVYPANGQQGLGTSLTFRWEECLDPDLDKVTYYLYYSTDPDFIGSTPIQITSLTKKNIYYASTASGLFFIGIVFAGSINGRKKIFLLFALILISAMLVVSCGSGGGGGGSSDGGGGSSPPPSDPLSDPPSDPPPTPPPSNDITQRVSGLNSGSTYYWKVVVNDGRGGVAESKVRSFTTK